MMQEREKGRAPKAVDLESPPIDAPPAGCSVLVAWEKMGIACVMHVLTTYRDTLVRASLQCRQPARMLTLGWP